MKKRNTFILFCLFIASGLMGLGGGAAIAIDVDELRSPVKSNAMIVLDISGSMGWPVYDQQIDYTDYWYWATGVTPVSVPLGYNDSSNTHKVITLWEKDKIYLVSAYHAYSEITGADGEKYAVVGDPMYPGSTKRELFISGGIIDTGWTYTDLGDPDTGVTIETVTDSEGQKWVVYPSAIPTVSGVTYPVNNYPTASVRYRDNAQAGVTFFNNQAVRLTDLRTDPRTNVSKDHGLIGYLKAPGLYFSGLFENNGTASYQLTDDPALAALVSGRERVYFFATGNYLSFLKVVEDLKNNAQVTCIVGQESWQKICYPEATWTATVAANITSHDTEYPCDRDTTTCSAGTYDYPNNPTGDFIRGTIDPAGTAISIKVKFDYIDTDACDPHAGHGQRNDYVDLQDAQGNSLLAIKGQQIGPGTGGAVSYDGGQTWANRSPLLDASGFTESIDTDSIRVVWHNGSQTGCSGYDRGFKITGYTYTAGATGDPGDFTCCNGTDGVGLKIRSRLEVAVEAVKLVLDATEGEIDWGLTTYGGSTGGTLRNQIGSSVAAIKTTLNGLTANGGTPMGEAMQDAYNFAHTYLDANPDTAACGVNYMVVLTDGFPSADNEFNRINSQSPGPNFSSAAQHDADTWRGDPNQTSGDYANYSDDVARWMNEGPEVDADNIDADYIFTTHTIGFMLESPLLTDIAKDGAGTNINAMSRGELMNSFYSLGILMSKTVTYVAPAVTVDEVNRTQSGDDLYLAFFQPNSGGHWLGNLKKYSLQYMIRTDCGMTEQEWVIVDQNGVEATDCDGTFENTSTSLWSAAPDGGKVNKGGVGARLKDSMPGTDDIEVPATGPYYDFRNIYTYKNGAIVRFWRDGDSGVTDTITAADLAVSSVAEYPVPNLERDKIINFIYGYTYEVSVDSNPLVYDEDTEGDPKFKRPWIMGDLIHSEPTIIDYLDSNADLLHRFIISGANDGILHVFTDLDITLGSTTYIAGSEIWAFIPGDLLPRLKEFQVSNAHPYLVDGFSTLHRARTKNANGYYYKSLVFGERRGGRSYWALDITEPDPSLWTVKWHIEGGVFSDELAQTWSRPTFSRIRTGSGTTDFTDVVVFGGGYDTEEDNYPEPFDDDNADGKWKEFNPFSESYTDVNGNSSYDTYNPGMNEMGRGIFVVNLSDGSHRFAATYGATDSTSGTSQHYSAMKWSFPANPTVIDLTSSLLIYMADIYGQIWKVTYDYNRSGEKWVVKRIFQANPGSAQTKAVDALTDPNPSLDTADHGRKMFYSPDVSFRGNDWSTYPVLYVGTGDRVHPRIIPNYHDRFYVFSDTDTLADETDLLNLTCDELDVNADVNQIGGIDAQDTSDKADLLDILYGYTTYSGGTARGWYRVMGKQGDCTQDSLDHLGERVVSKARLFYGSVYFSTYQPVFGDACNPSGNALIYALDYSDGSAAMDLNMANSTEHTLADTYQVISNSSIPSGVRIITRKGKAAGLISAGGKVTGAGEEESAGTEHSTSIPGPPGGLSKILWETY